MSWIKNMWEKSIFPDMIEERRLRKEVERAARMEAITESKDDLKAAYKQKAKDKILNKKSFGDRMQKFADNMGGNVPDSNKIQDLMGSGKSNSNEDKINKMLGR